MESFHQGGAIVEAADRAPASDWVALHSPHRAPDAQHLGVTIRDVAALAGVERQEMWALYSRFYDGSSAVRFTDDLAGKHFVLMLRDAAGALQGFSTIALWTKTFESNPIRVLFSGDTIVERAYWGSQALAFNWLRFAGTLQRLHKTIPLYWFLIVKGQRTYRYLPTFAREFVPHWRGGSSPYLERLVDSLAKEHFGAAYDPNTGVVRFDESHGHLAPEWASVSERELARDDVRFFLQRNPGYARGDELVCVCKLEPDNLRSLARRVFMGGSTQ